MPETLPISTTQELVRFGSSSAAAFTAYTLREGLNQTRHANFPAGDVTLAGLCALGEVEFAERLPTGLAALLRPEPGMLVLVTVSRGQGEVGVAGVDRVAVDSVAAGVIACLREVEADDGCVAVTFWAYSSGAPLQPRRRIEAPEWAGIRENYATTIRAPLDELMQATGAGPGGLIVWHGDPGTGKSYALRALARAWRPWCDVHVITDADAYLGGRTNYLMSTLLRQTKDAEGNPRLRLIVLEDAGELLAADARVAIGQGLSRLLNLTDGLLGAGLGTSVLVTTNEPVTRLHPAVVRPGRTWAQIGFPLLSAEESDAWLAAHGSDARMSRSASLAELFALADGRTVAGRGGLGFAA